MNKDNLIEKIFNANIGITGEESIYLAKLIKKDLGNDNLSSLNPYIHSENDVYRACGFEDPKKIHKKMRNNLEKANEGTEKISEMIENLELIVHGDSEILRAYLADYINLKKREQEAGGLSGLLGLLGGLGGPPPKDTE